MDKTVIPITGNEFLGTMLSVKKNIEQWEEEYQQNKIDDYTFANRMSTILYDKSLKAIYKLLTKLPVLKHTGKTIKTLHRENIFTALITVGPSFIAHYLKQKYGFDNAIGTEHLTENGVFCGKLGRVLTDKDKLSVSKKLLRTYHISLNQCVAVGDGKSDIPLFENCGFSIALNAQDQTVIKKAKISIFTDSLYDIIPYIIEK